jgi:Zn-dependent peptidase ImmA (M78 family)
MSKEEDAALRLLHKHHIHKPPVPVEDIARGEGAQIARHRFDGTESGFTLRDGEHTIIGVNTRTSPRRQRFTIAHEVGHFILHDDAPLIIDHSMRVYWRNEVSSMATDEQEIEANAFAAALLMPRELVISHLKSYISEIENSRRALSREDLIAHLAREFDVSAEAMGYRLINLGILAT